MVLGRGATRDFEHRKSILISTMNYKLFFKSVGQLQFYIKGSGGIGFV